MRIPTALVHEAFTAAGEKHFGLARPFYTAAFGGRWREALLGFAYMKCLDALVDEDPDADRALRTLDEHRRFVAGVYGRARDSDPMPVPQRFGYPVLCCDRDRGEPMRAVFETVIETMERDTRRRGRFFSAAVLDDMALELGGNVIRFLMYFAAPGVPVPAEFIVPASRAYLHADSLIDLEHDLGFGVINIPSEDFERYGMQLSAGHPRVRAWIEARSAAVLDDFRAALAEARRLPRRSMALLATLYLVSKRRSLRRFLDREQLRPGPDGRG